MFGFFFKYATFLMIILSSSSAFSAAPLPVKQPSHLDNNAVLFDVIAGEIALGRGETGFAFDALSTAAKVTDNSQLAERALYAAFSGRNVNQAVEAATLWAAIDPRAETPHQTLLANAVDTNNLKSIQTELQALYEIVPDKGKWVASTAILFSRMPANVPTFIKAFEPYAQKHIDRGDVLFGLGLLAQSQKDRPKACQYGLKAIKASPDDENIVSSVADICWSTAPYNARDILQNFLKRHPSNARVRLIYGRVMVRMNQPDQAIIELKRAARNAKTDPLVLYNAGQLAMECQALDLAKRYFLDYVHLIRETQANIDLASNDVWLHLGAIASVQKNYKAASTYFSEIIDGPHYKEARIKEAEALALTNRLDDAREVLTSARDQDVANSTAYFSAEAELLVQFNHPEEGLKLMARATKLNPREPGIWYDAGMLAERLGKTDIAEKYLQKVLSLNPNHIQANNALGYIYVDHNKKLKQARKLLEHAYQLSPLDPYVLDSMGWLYFREGDYVKAQEFVLTSLKKMFDEEVAMHLIEILHIQQRNDEAKDFYLQLLERSVHKDKVLSFGKRLGIQ